MKFLIFSLMIAVASSAFAGKSFDQMKALTKMQLSTSLRDEARAEGYEIKKLNKVPVIKREYKEFRKFLRQNEREQQELFNSVVDSGELDYLGVDRDQLKKDAKKHFEADYLFEIKGAYVVTKDGELIGYILEVSEHGQSEVYQDGAWSEVYLDKNFKVVFQDRQSA